MNASEKNPLMISRLDSGGVILDVLHLPIVSHYEIGVALLDVLNSTPILMLAPARLRSPRALRSVTFAGKSLKVTVEVSGCSAGIMPPGASSPTA